LDEEELQALSRGHVGAQDQEGVIDILQHRAWRPVDKRV
jgi:hypothetical protein